jgi:hypothetical protein
MGLEGQERKTGDIERPNRRTVNFLFFIFTLLRETHHHVVKRREVRGLSGMKLRNQMTAEWETT